MKRDESKNIIKDEGEKIADVRVTLDYTLFRFHKSNRIVETPRLKRMIRLMKEHGGWLMGSCVFIDIYGVIIDGQSRFLAAQFLGLPVTYCRLNIVATAELIRKNNTNRVNWSLEDTHKGLVAEGNEDSIQLDNFRKNHPDLKFTDILMLAKTSTRSIYRHEIEGGTFKMKDPEISEDWAQKIEAFKPYVPTYNSRGFSRTIVQLCINPNVSFTELMTKAARYPYMVVDYKQVDRNLEMFEKLYNKGRRSKNRIKIAKL